MNWKGALLLLFVALAVTMGGLAHSGSVRAQQAQPEPTPTPSPTPSPSPSPEDEVIKVDTEIVNVIFTAQDKDRRLITDLNKDDVQLLEDGEVQDIVDFNRQVALPLSIAVLIDTSASQERTLPEEKMAAKSFIDAVVRPEKDEVAIISFTGEATLEQGMTNNLQRLAKAIDRVKFVPPSGYLGGGVVVGGNVPGTPPISGGNQSVQGSTAIWDAIWVTSDEILGPAPEKTRRAIILLTDGVNTFGRKKLDDAVKAAQKAEAVIYSIGIGDNFYSGVDTGSLKKISERTGGRAFFPRDEEELRRAFAQIQLEMRSQYLIAYEPSNQKRDGSYRQIEIRLINPDLVRQRVTLSHREGYFAKKEKQ